MNNTYASNSLHVIDFMIHRLLLIALFILVPLLVSSQNRDIKPAQYLDAARKAMEQGDYAKAVENFNRYLSTNPSLPDAYYQRGLAKEQLQDLNGALTDLSIYLELRPDHYEAMLSRANVRYRLGKFEQAREDYLNLLKIAPGETNTVMFQKSATTGGTTQITSAQSNLKPVLFNYLGLTEYRMKNFSEATRWLDSAVYHQPKEPDYYVNRAMVKEQTDPTAALRDYQYALKLNPSHSLALHNLGVLNARIGGKVSTDDFFEQAMESDSTMLAPYIERAYQRMQGGYFKGALEDYNHALDLLKTDPELWLNRGFVKEKLNDLKGALSDYTQAIALKEDYEKAWLNRGNVLTKLQRYKEAIEDYNTVIAFHPDYAAAYYNRAAAKDRLKLKSEACADLMKAQSLGMEIDPKVKSGVCK